MNDVMILRRGGGGGSGKLFAAVQVSYPIGSTCTATNGSKTLKANDSSGLALFSIPEPKALPETWTITATDGTNTKSVSVEITEKGQIMSVELTYRTVIFSTTAYSGWSKKMYESGEGSATFNANGITLEGSNPGGSNYAYWTMAYKKVTRNALTTLGFNITSLTKGAGVKIWASNSLPDFEAWFDSMGFGASTSISKTGEATVDVSSLASDIYVGIICCGNSKVVATEAWLE